MKRAYGYSNVCWDKLCPCYLLLCTYGVWSQRWPDFTHVSPGTSFGVLFWPGVDQDTCGAYQQPHSTNVEMLTVTLWWCWWLCWFVLFYMMIMMMIILSNFFSIIVRLFNFFNNRSWQLIELIWLLWNKYVIHKIFLTHFMKCYSVCVDVGVFMLCFHFESFTFHRLVTERMVIQTHALYV